MSTPSIQLASGKFFHFLEAKSADINPRDIAAHLSKLCRWTGAVSKFYSVAQHSVHVSEIVPPEMALVGLLHDATEAYINDLSRPAKRLAPEYVAYEKEVLWPLIAARFGLPEVIPEEIHIADNIMLVTERRDLMPPMPPEHAHAWAWTKDIIPTERKIYPLTPDQAEASFRRAWKRITGETL